MNKFFVRGLFYIFIVLLIGIIIKKSKYNYLISKKWFVFAVIIFILCIDIFIPFKTVYFDTLEEAFKYNIPNEKIVNKYEFDDYVLVFYGISDSLTYSVFKNDEEGWKYVNLKVKYNEDMFHNDTWITSVELKNIGYSMIWITFLDEVDIDAITISDSIDSKFHYIDTFAYTIIDNFDSNYQLFLNNEKIILLK